MITNNFPLKQKQQYDYQANQEINKLSEQKNQNIRNLKNQYTTSSDTNSYIGMGAIIGAAAAIFQCTTTWMDVDPAFFNLLLYTGIGAAAGGLIGLSAKDKATNKEQKITPLMAETRNF